MGVQAATLLVERIGGASHSARRIVLGTDLIVRDELPEAEASRGDKVKKLTTSAVLALAGIVAVGSGAMASIRAAVESGPAVDSGPAVERRRVAGAAR